MAVSPAAAIIAIWRDLAYKLNTSRPTARVETHLKLEGRLATALRMKLTGAIRAMLNRGREWEQPATPVQHEDPDPKEKSSFPWIQKYLDLADLLIRRNKQRSEIKKREDHFKKPKAA